MEQSIQGCSGEYKVEVEQSIQGCQVAHDKIPPHDMIPKAMTLSACGGARDSMPVVSVVGGRWYVLMTTDDGR